VNTLQKLKGVILGVLVTTGILVGLVVILIFCLLINILGIVAIPAAIAAGIAYLLLTGKVKDIAEKEETELFKYTNIDARCGNSETSEKA